MIVHCKTCESKMDCEVLASFQKRDHPSELPVKYSFVKCKRCKSPILVGQEDLGGPIGLDSPFVLYPPEDKIVDPNLPDSIRKAFNEALTCFTSRAYLGTALLCRRTLEMICHDHKSKKRTLASQLKDMKDNGIIDVRLFDWAEALRVSGNEAAHSADVNIGQEDAQDLVDFTHALLEYVYTYRDKYNTFMERKGKK